jgi:aminoglycoside phosphotransferase (APT) family kinase protein
VTAADAARPVRDGEALDAARLHEWLRGALAGFEGPLEVRQFPAGFSNLTYLLATPGAEYVLRRPPFGTRPKSGHDMAREYRVLRALAPVFPFCPRALALCEDETVIGAPFYVAQRLQGLILRRDYPPGLEPTPGLVRAQQEALVDVLARLHSVDYVAAGLESLGRPAGYVGRQVEGWIERFERSRTPDSPAVRELADWLQSSQPAESPGAALLHNDYKLDNVVFDLADPARLIGVLDWEMATLGDPRMDLGCSLAYWVEAGDPPWFAATRTLPTHLTGSLTRGEVIARYAAARGAVLDGMDFFLCFGLFRLATVAQQIYLRHVRGETRDPRFAALGAMVQALARAASRTAAGQPIAGG